MPRAASSLDDRKSGAPHDNNTSEDVDTGLGTIGRARLSRVYQIGAVCLSKHASGRLPCTPEKEHTIVVCQRCAAGRDRPDPASVSGVGPRFRAPSRRASGELTPLRPG